MKYQTVYKAMTKKADGLDPAFLEAAKLQAAKPLPSNMIGSGLTEHPRGYYGPVIGKLPNGKTVTVGDVGYAAGRGVRTLAKGLAKKTQRATPEQKATIKAMNDKYVKPLAPTAEALGNKLKNTWFGRGFNNGVYKADSTDIQKNQP